MLLCTSARPEIAIFSAANRDVEPGLNQPPEMDGVLLAPFLFPRGHPCPVGIDPRERRPHDGASDSACAPRAFEFRKHDSARLNGIAHEDNLFAFGPSAVAERNSVGPEGHSQLQDRAGIIETVAVQIPQLPHPVAHSLWMHEQGLGDRFSTAVVEQPGSQRFGELLCGSRLECAQRCQARASVGRRARPRPRARPTPPDGPRCRGRRGLREGRVLDGPVRMTCAHRPRVEPVRPRPSGRPRCGSTAGASGLRRWPPTTRRTPARARRGPPSAEACGCLRRPGPIAPAPREGSPRSATRVATNRLVVRLR